MRYLHILSAVAAVGGTLCLAVCVSPAVRLLDASYQDSVLKLVRHRFHRLVWMSIGGLVVSGAYNWVVLGSTYKAMGPYANALIGTKVLLAMIMFAVTWLGSVDKLKARAVQMINIHLAAVVILLAVVLRHYRLDHLQGLAGGG